MNVAQILKPTVEDYLNYDDAADCRCEFHDGEIFRMDDTSVQHGLIEANVLGEMRSALKGKPCRAYGSLRIRATASNFMRPDAVVLCGQAVEVLERRAVTNPTLIVEILSPSTADYDFGGKFRLYREIETFAEYVLVSQTSPRVEVFRKNPAGEWVLSTYVGLEKSIPLPSIGAEIPMAEIYDGVEFDPA